MTVKRARDNQAGENGATQRLGVGDRDMCRSDQKGCACASDRYMTPCYEVTKSTWREHNMSQMVAIKLEVPNDLARFRLPDGVNARLQLLLDRQEGGQRLTLAERKEAEGLVNLAELLSLLRLRVERIGNRRTKS